MKKWQMLCILASPFFLLADNIQQVKNGKTPKEGYTLKLTEDLRFGSDDGEDEYLWPGSTVTLQANSKGHMFVMDPLAKRILEFDPKGKFVKQIGGPGEGPGEFTFISQFQVFPDDTIMTFGRSGAQSVINFFDAQGNYVDQVTGTSPAFILQQVVYSPDKKRIGATALLLDFQKPFMTTVFSLLNDKFEPQEEIFKYETPSVNPQRFGESAYWVEFMADQFKPFAQGLNVFFAFHPDGTFYTSIAKSYEITKWDANGKKQMVISRDYSPIPQSQEEIMAIVDPVLEILNAQLPPQLQSIVTQNVIEQAVTKAEFPPRKNPINGMLLMEDGALLVIHDNSALTSKATADIFSKEGKFLGSFSLGGNALPRMSFKNGYAYTIETNGEDDNEVVRYKASIVPR